MVIVVIVVLEPQYTHLHFCAKFSWCVWFEAIDLFWYVAHTHFSSQH
jgi:hypothetical protein